MSAKFNSFKNEKEHIAPLNFDRKQNVKVIA